MKPFTDDPPEPPASPSTRRRAEHGLYKVAFAYVWTTLRSLGIPEQDREDLALMILAAAHDKRRAYEPVRGSPAQWLHGFAVNFARRYWQQRPPGPQRSLDEVPEALLATARPEDQGMAEEQRDFLYKELLARLPFDQRAVVVARDLDELDFKDIARLQEIPLSTAYERYDRAHATLVLLYARWKKQDKRSSALVLPMTLAQLFTANRFIPDPPAAVEQAVWKRLQRARRWAPFRAFFEQPWVRMTLAALLGAALHAALQAALQPPPRKQITIVEVPAPVPLAAERAASPPVEPSTPPPPASAPAIVAASPSSLAQVAGDPLEELRIFEAAGRAFKRGDLDAALSSLQRLARAHPHGTLASEREQLWIQVLVQRGQSAEARARIDRLRGTAQGKALVPELEDLIPEADGGSGALPEP